MKLIPFILLLCCKTAIAGTLGLYQDSQSWTGNVYGVIIGDSLAAGGGGCAIHLNGLRDAISTASGGRLTFSNLAVGGSCWNNGTNGPTIGTLIGPNDGNHNWRSQPNSQTMYGQISNVWAFGLSPRWVFVQMGRNDKYPFSLAPSELYNFLTEGYPTYWPVIQRGLEDLLTNCIAHNAKLMIGEILPANIASSGTDAQMQESSIQTVTNYNLGYYNFALTNQGTVFVSSQHDAFGVWDSATPGYNLLNSNYWNCSTDTLHINQAAYDMWGPLFVTNLAGFFKDPYVFQSATIDNAVFR